MKKNILILSAILALTTMLGSCNSKKDQVQSFSEQVVAYVNNNQPDSLATVYPDAEFDSLAFKSFEGINVESPNDKGEYRVTFGPDTWMDVAIGEDGKLSVSSSHGLVAFPEDKVKIGLETGMLNDSITDAIAQERISDEDFYKWLKNKRENKGNGVLTVTPGKEKYKGSMYSEIGTTSLTCTVKNNSAVDISGKDYTLTYSIRIPGSSDGSAPDGFYKKTKPGVDVPAGEERNISISASCIGISNVKVNLKIPEDKLKEMTKSEGGNEYDEYLATKIKGD